MKQPIKLDFSDFWSSFNKTNNYLYHLLSKYYDIDISDEPEFLIYSDFGKKYKNYSDVVKIFFTGENTLPDFTQCDYALSFATINTERSYRFPLYGWWYNQKSLDDRTLSTLVQPRQFDSTILSEKEFCGFVVSNPYCRVRNRFFEKLSAYQRVNSGGRYQNNVGGPVADKAAFLKQHKFTIAFENSSTPGYTTEKLSDAYLAGTIPIYWGNPLVGKDFNRKAFICAHDFDSIDAVIRRVIELDNDDDRYLEMLNQPLVAGEINACVREENVIKFFDFAFTTGRNQQFVTDPNYWVQLQARKLREDLRMLVPQPVKQSLKSLVNRLSA
jgi:alpha(1,3/1,4) fucosyltransferase